MEGQCSGSWGPAKPAGGVGLIQWGLLQLVHSAARQAVAGSVRVLSDHIHVLVQLAGAVSSLAAGTLTSCRAIIVHLPAMHGPLSDIRDLYTVCRHVVLLSYIDLHVGLLMTVYASW